MKTTNSKKIILIGFGLIIGLSIQRLVNAGYIIQTNVTSATQTLEKIILKNFSSSATGLILDGSGSKIYASSYCDQNGTNCKSIGNTLTGESDPKIGNLYTGSLCYATGGQVVCNQTEKDQLYFEQIKDIGTGFFGYYSSGKLNSGGLYVSSNNLFFNGNIVALNNYLYASGAIINGSIYSSGLNINGPATVTGNTTIFGDLSITGTNGNGTFKGNVTANAFFYSSDRNLKKNLVKIPNALDKILALNGYYFNWKSDNSKSVGVIAQEIEKIFPELVKTDANGMKSVEYGNLVAPLIEAIKDLNDKVELQNKKIIELEKSCK